MRPSGPGCSGLRTPFARCPSAIAGRLLRRAAPAIAASARNRGTCSRSHAGSCLREHRDTASHGLQISNSLRPSSQRLCGRGIRQLQSSRQPPSRAACPQGVQQTAPLVVGQQVTRATTAAFASMMRGMLRGSPRQLLRTLLRVGTRLMRPLLTGPGSVFVLLVTLVGGIVATVRARMWATCRNCSQCHGFGIQRCSLCTGAGSVGWEGKWNHSELCPSCLGKRFVSCPECGGHFHRATFVHARHRGRAAALESMDSGDAEDQFLDRMVAD